jgi:hypothetical protein
MCKCLEEIEVKVKDKFVSVLKNKGKAIHEFIDESESGFTCKGLMFSSGNWEFVLPMQYKYIIEKNDGEPEKRKSTYKTNFIPSFCPICGKKIKHK